MHVFKNNVGFQDIPSDAMKTTLVRRFVPLEVIEHELLLFLITRQLFTGAGRVTESGFQITQRADFLDEAVSSATTKIASNGQHQGRTARRSRRLPRLHVIIGDSNPNGPR